MNNRINELDSIRGLAAISVLLSHILPSLPLFLEYTPLRIFWAGHEAVILFFVLSGFVLSFPFIKYANVKYDEYLIKRFFRIYVPYILAVIFALMLKDWLFSDSVAQKMEGNIIYWTKEMDLITMLNHFLLVTNFNTDVLNPVVWSLVHEMRISIIFPFIMIVLLRLKWTQSLALAMIFSCVGMIFINNDIGSSEGYLTSYGHSIHYTSMFIIGALLSINLEKIISLYKGLSLINKISILFMGLCFYTLQIGLGKFFTSNLLIHYSEWLIGMGSLIFIVVSLSSRKVSKILSIGPVKYFGKISYSLYLYHLPVIIACYYVLGNMLPSWQIIIIAVILSFIISTIAWYFVEENSVKLARTIIGVIKARRGRKINEKITENI